MADDYFVCEFRLPILISEADSPKDAAEKAKKQLEKELGINLSSWYIRIFQYLSGEEQMHPIEFFFNPNGNKIFQMDKNHKGHEELISDERRQSNQRPKS